MNFGFSLGDFVTVPTLAWQVYKSCKESSDDFKSIAGDVAGLHIVLKEVEEQLEEHPFDEQRCSQLATLVEPCHTVLTQLESLIERYDGLGSKSQRTWDRLKWGLEDVSRLKERLLTSTAILAAFNTSLVNSSQSRVEKKLNQLLFEIRTGKREASVVSVQSVESLSASDKDAWRQLRKDLKDVGITPSLFLQHRSFIVSWFQNILELGGLDETAVDSFDDARTRDSSRKTTPFATNQPQSLKSIQVSSSFTQKRISSRSVRLASNQNIALRNPPVPATPPLTPSRQCSTPEQISTLMNEKLSLSEWSLHQRDSRGFTLLHHACANVLQVETVELLLKHGANIHVKDLQGRRPPDIAIDHGNTAALKCIFRHRKPMWDFWQSTILHEPARTGNVEMAQLLLDQGALVFVRDSRGLTPLHIAARYGSVEMIRLLIEKGGADVNSPQLHEDSILTSGSTALHIAAFNMKVDAVKALLNYDASTLVKDDEDNTALHITARHSLSDETDIMLMLIQHGAEIDPQNNIGMTPLDEAAYRGHFRMVRLLIKHGARRGSHGENVTIRSSEN